MGKQSAVKGLLESLERHCAWAMSRRRASSFAETEYFSAESEASGSESFTMETLPVTRADKLNLPTIASGCELAASAQNVPLESRRTAGDEEPRRRTWKEASGRSGGRDGYRLGDVSRTLFQKTRSQSRTLSFESSSDVDEAASWPGTLTATGDGAEWVTSEQLQEFDKTAVDRLTLQGLLHKYHTSRARGSVLPQWSLRYYDLRPGNISYSRREGSKSRGSISLDGARVVLEPPKTSRRGDCFVFQIIAGKDVSWRLSCFDRKTATKWVVTLVGVCAYYRSLNCPGPVSSSGRCGMTNHAPATGSVE